MVEHDPSLLWIQFEQIEPYKPRGVALAEGGIMAVLLMMGVVNAINHGGNKVPAYSIGMHRPGIGLIKLNRAELEGELNTIVKPGQDPEDPLKAYARSYFRMVRVLPALDTDGDLTISTEEMQNAPAALRTLDRNHDGVLSAEECGFLGERDFMLRNPVLAALDSDPDGRISAGEIENSPAMLRSLDIDYDGKLMRYELMPYRAVSEAAGLMTRFDTFDTGVIAMEGVTGDDADVASIRSILPAADRNHDGVVTRGELVVELASRAAARN